ncbi:MAG: hypothetical protein LQ340_002929 [Diploschistes diacapsis]|nr:MAG: hypothetical protein LQ340_002929 [Diploschistes diacapsis]
MVALHPSWIMNFSQFRELERNLVMPSNVDEPTTAELALMDHMYEHDPDLRKMHINLDKSDREFEKRRKTSYRMSDLFVEEEGKDLLGQRLIWRRRGLFRTISSHGKSEIQLLQGFAALKESGSLNAVEPRNLGSKHLDIWLNPLEFFSLKEGGLQVGCIWNFNLVAICNKPPVWKRTEDRTQAITSEIQSKQLDFDLCPHVRVADDRIISAAVQSGLHDCGPCKKEPLNGNISATQRDAAEGELDQGSQSFKEFGEADTESMYEETEDKLNKGPFLSEQDQNNRSKLHLSFIRATDCEKCQTIFKVAITQPREAMVNRDGVYRHFRADHNCLVVAVLRNLGRAETMFNLTWLNHSELHDQHSYTNLRHRSTYQPRICVDYSYPGVRAWGEARTRRLRAGMGIWPH